MPRSRWSSAVVLAVWTGVAWAQTAGDVSFSDPSDGAVVEGGPWIKVTGRARGSSPPVSTAFDVMIVMDTSGSTAHASGLWVDPEGRFKTTGGGSWSGWFRGQPASILDAEVAAAIQFLGVANRATTRVGVITFAGAFEVMTGYGIRGSTNARVAQPLTADYEAVRAALVGIRQRGSGGGTDMSAGLRLAVRDLLALKGTLSEPRPGVRKVALLLTDGYPTLPFGAVNSMDPANVEAVFNAARLAAKGGIVIHTFCLGPEALATPIACTGTARITGGLYNPVENPGDIVNVLPATPIGHVELLVVRNGTTGQMARSLSVSSDGVFTAEVPLAPGANRLVAELHGSGGQGTATLVVHYRAGDVQVEVERARQPNVEIQVERPRPSDRQLDLRIERPELKR